MRFITQLSNDEKAHLISDFRKKISPQVGLEPTKMRQDLKKSVSVLPEGEEKILSFRWDFRYLARLDSLGNLSGL